MHYTVDFSMRHYAGYSQIGSHFTSINGKMNIKPYKALCATNVTCSIKNLPYMIFALSLSWEACGRVFLNGHV